MRGKIDDDVGFGDNTIEFRGRVTNIQTFERIVLILKAKMELIIVEIERID
jgi:hypothetical protein